MKKLLTIGLLVAGFGAASQASIEIGTGLDGSGNLLPWGSFEQNYAVSGNAGGAVVYTIGYPWVPNSPNGQWISPADAAGRPAQPYGDTYYTRWLGAGTITGMFSSDNPGELLVNGVPIVANAGFPSTDLGTYGGWTTFSAQLTQSANSVVFDVVNLGGPAGLIVDGTFTATPVPEPSTIVAGALLLVPFAFSGLRNLRKNRA